ncbi:anti-sigma factor domain-containing protein [Actinoplanes sp. DH11]|uniref:anti-sigma factor n=1 Tax=Actinoplanes sp. DH11 TaxID=2857011 RepID=UPI001E60425E|nr:anti-sigma factor [Actinoplanes sp. DH11]
MSADIHALVGAYALDALDELERTAFERHLRDCEPCRLEADDLGETAARLADGAWSVPPPRLRENVLAAVATTRQAPVAVRSARSVRPARRLRLVAAAAVVVALAGAGAAAITVQEQRVRRAEAVAEAARDTESRIRAILTAPDVVLRDEPLTSGGRVTVASSRLSGAGVIMLAADGAPAADRVYQLWTIRAGAPRSEGPLATGQSTVTRVVEGLPGASAVGVTVEPAPGSATPTTPLDALVTIT